jgi:hypothetical protein
MKKLNATKAIAILSLGLTLSVVVAGCGGNDTSESALTKNAALGSSDGGAGGDTTKSAPTTEAKAGISDGGQGGITGLCGSYETFGGLESAIDRRSSTASEVACMSIEEIKNFSPADLVSLCEACTKALTTAQLNSMSKAQLNALIKSNELTDAQLVTVNTKLGN